MQNVRFSTSVRGYDRAEVHRYILKVNTLLAELRITAAPEYAIKAALESVQEERGSVIAEAEQEAEEITRRSRSQADDRIEEAKREAEQLRDAAAEEAGGTIAGAETRIRVLQAHVDEMLERRDRAVVELVELSRILDELLERNGANGVPSAEPAEAAQPSRRLSPAGAFTGCDQDGRRHHRRVARFRARSRRPGAGRRRGDRYRADEQESTGSATAGHRASRESVVVKLAATDQNSRDVGVNLGVYLREITFYRELRDRIDRDGTLAKCHLAEHDPEEGWFTLVLEDIEDGVQGDQIAGCGPDEARIAMVALARIHAPVFGDLALAATDWLNQPNPLNQALLTALLPSFLERYRGRIAPEHVEVCERFVASADAWEADRRPPLGLVHGDYRLDNILFHNEACTVVDWQTLGRGPVMRDAAYFIGGALPVEERRAHEASLLRAYYDELLAQGVAGFSWEQCWEEYRRQCFLLLVMTIAPAMVVERTERGDDMFMAVFGRLRDGDRPERPRAPARAERGRERAAATGARRRGLARSRPRAALERELVLRRGQRRRRARRLPPDRAAAEHGRLPAHYVHRPSRRAGGHAGRWSAPCRRPTTRPRRSSRR